MSFNAKAFLNKTLGEDFFESLQKFEIYKPGTKTVLDHEEIRTALKIVPRAIMSFLVTHLSSMNIGETKELSIPLENKSPILKITKVERDVFNGEILDDTEKYKSKKVAEFKYRSIPGVGLIILSTFELYEIDELEKEPKIKIEDSLTNTVQKLIDERLALQDLINRVVDKKISERDAIQQLILAKLNNELEKNKETVKEISKLSRTTAPMSDEYFRGIANGVEVVNATINDKEPDFVEPQNKKGLPLKNFLEKRKEKKNKKYAIVLEKTESISCPDCGQRIFNETGFSACVCLGDAGKVHFKKTENNKVKLSFGKNWDKDNLEMLLEILRRKHG